MASSAPAGSWTPDLRDRSVTLDRINSIAFTPMNATLRNQLITQAYGDLAEAMARLLGARDITWCALGAWASDEIGGYLDLPVPILGRIIRRPFADGNRDVFADIGQAHAHFLATVGAAHERGDDLDEAWRTCRRRLKRGLLEPPGRIRGDVDRFWDSITDEPLDPRRPTNQRVLIRGFRAYRDAISETDPEARSQLILVGNMLLALHEQRHLSLPISVGFRSWLRTLTMPSKPLETQRGWMNRDPSRWRIRLEDRWISIATRLFIGITLADETIKVAKPVPNGDDPIPIDQPHPHLAERPAASLAHLRGRLEIDRRPARHWNALRDRMAYIASVFVEHQRDDRWWADRDAGLLARPEPAPGFELAVDATNEHFRLRDQPPEAASASPLTDDVLDELRRHRSEPTPPDGPIDLARLHDRGDQQNHSASRDSMLARVEGDLEARLAAVTSPDGPLTPATCLRARAFFRRWEVVIMMGLLFRSLPEAYAAADGVRVIGATSHLSSDAFRRSGETAHFVRDLLANDAGWSDDGRLISGGDAWRSLRGLRGLHALVSANLVAEGWDTDTHGEPINHEDMLGTALSFAVPVIELMRDLGIDVDEADRDAFLQFWLGIGHLLGAPLDVVTVATHGRTRPLTWQEATGLAAAIRRRHHRRSFDGVRLTEALVHGIGDGFPRRFTWLAPGLMQALGDPRVTHLLLAGHGPGRSRAATIARLLRIGLGFPVTRPLMRAAVQAGGRRWLEPFLDVGTARPYRTPVRMQRQPAIAAIEPSYWPFGWPDD